MTDKPLIPRPRGWACPHCRHAFGPRPAAICPDCGEATVMPQTPDEALTLIEREVARLTEENERLRAIADRLPTTADGVPIVQNSLEKVWRSSGPEGLPQRCEYFQNGFAVFRGSTYSELCPIPNCYSTREAAGKARAT